MSDIVWITVRAPLGALALHEAKAGVAASARRAEELEKLRHEAAGGPPIRSTRRNQDVKSVVAQIERR